VVKGMKVNVLDDFYKLLHPCVTVLVASSWNDRSNVMTCAWNMPVSEDPPLVAIALSRESYTNEIIRKSGDFTINIPDETLLNALWICGTRSGRKVDKARLAGLKLSPAKKVKSPIVEDCIGHLECKLDKFFEVGECTVFIGEVLEAYASREAFSQGIWNVKKIRLPLHLGGDRFALPTEVIRPQKRRS